MAVARRVGFFTRLVHAAVMPIGSTAVLLANPHPSEGSPDPGAVRKGMLWFIPAAGRRQMNKLLVRAARIALPPPTRAALPPQGPADFRTAIAA